jgi:acyl carrier protein phosphodiesterase
MNFLAHLYLSGSDAKLMVGNFIGDFVKGKAALENFEAGIVEGIQLHRAIDAFTDTHSVVNQSKSRLRLKYRHYAGVIVDVFYDHFLAKNWNHYHAELLPDFAHNVYKVLESYKPILPEKVNYMLPFMIRHNWLVNYAKPEGIHRALSGMAQRTTFDSKMDEAITDLQENYGLFAREFESFFPVLAQYCSDWLKSKGSLQ